MKHLKSTSDFFQELSESSSAGSRTMPYNLHLKNSYIYDPRLHYNHEALMKDLYINLDKAVLTKTAVMQILGKYYNAKNIQDIKMLNNTQLRDFISDLNIYIDYKEQKKLQDKVLPGGLVHAGKTQEKRSKEKGDLYFDPLSKEYIFVSEEGEESRHSDASGFLFKNS